MVFLSQVDIQNQGCMVAGGLKKLSSLQHSE